jgi:hypothetical protein
VWHLQTILNAIVLFKKKAIHPYVATQPDELSLEVADVVNVLRKMADGNIFFFSDSTESFYIMNNILKNMK